MIFLKSGLMSKSLLKVFWASYIEYSIHAYFIIRCGIVSDIALLMINLPHIFMLVHIRQVLSWVKIFAEMPIFWSYGYINLSRRPLGTDQISQELAYIVFLAEQTR